MSARNYKGIYVNSFGIPIKNPYQNKIENKFGETKRIYNISFSSNFNKNSPKNLIVIYDVPENKKKERDWFRRHLKKFGYIMIQRSVWVGHSPLPKDFIDYVKSIGLKDKLKTSKLAKEYTKETNLFN
jgi:CRISPR-associated endonuclease Cas2